MSPVWNFGGQIADFVPPKKLLVVTKGSYLFLNKKIKDFSRTLKDTFPIFQGLHLVEKRALSLRLF